MCFNMDHSLIPDYQSQKHYCKVNGIRAQDKFLLSDVLYADGFSPGFYSGCCMRAPVPAKIHVFCFTLKLIWFLRETSEQDRLKWGSRVDAG